MDDSAVITCPYCGERFAVAIDASEGVVQDFTYDCENCCRTIAIHCVSSDDGSVDVSVCAESDS